VKVAFAALFNVPLTVVVVGLNTAAVISG